MNFYQYEKVAHKHVLSHSFVRNVYKDWVKQIHSPSKHRTSESILSLYPAEAPALVFLWGEKSGVIRRSSYVCHLELKGLRLNFKLMSFPHFDFHPIMQSTPYPLLFFDLQSSPHSSCTSFSFFFFSPFSLSNNRMSLPWLLTFQANRRAARSFK